MLAAALDHAFQHVGPALARLVPEAGAQPPQPQQMAVMALRTQAAAAALVAAHLLAARAALAS
jgi:hypothetical protein